MKILFGLGNPEQQYAGTRHNVGFWALNLVAETYSAQFKPERKFKALVAEASIAGEKVLFVKPQTYYNEAGQAARALLDFYKLAPGDILVCHDDLALPLGTIRTRLGGSSGGNNGLQSLQQHIGTDTARLRIGVQTEQQSTTDKVGVVLGKLSKTEQATLNDHSDTILKVVAAFARDAFAPTTHREPTELS